MEVPQQVIEIVERNLDAPSFRYNDLSLLKEKMEKAIKDYEDEKSFIEEIEREKKDVRDWLNEVKNIK